MTSPASAPTVRPQVEADGPTVGDVIAAAFVDEPGVVALEVDLAARPDSHGYVADVEGGIVGHVRLTRAWIDAPDRLVEALVLSPLSVLPAFQGRGVGTALLDHAVSAADALGAPAVFLEGDPGFYGSRGWRPAADVAVTAPSDRIPAPAFQVVLLSGYEPWMTGRFVYPDTFWSHDSVGLRGDVLAEVRRGLGLD